CRRAVLRRVEVGVVHLDPTLGDVAPAHPNLRDSKPSGASVSRIAYFHTTGAGPAVPRLAVAGNDSSPYGVRWVVAGARGDAPVGCGGRQIRAPVGRKVVAE